MPRTRTRLSIGDARSLNWRTHAPFPVPALLSADFFDFDRLGGRPARPLAITFGGWLGSDERGYRSSECLVQEIEVD
jgi:hypothetical protein